MKRQTLDRKLVLNKKTVSNLEVKEMKHLKGGIPPTLKTTCVSDNPDCKTDEICSCGYYCL